MKSLFENKKITIMGLGLHGGGVGVAKFFCRQGAKVLVTDLKTKEQLKESLLKLKNLPIKYVLGRHKEKNFINTDLVVKNPAVPRDSYYLKIARKHNVLIETDITIFFKLCKAPIIGITGTKGKSTVATLVYCLLKTKYLGTLLAGNIGYSALEILSKITPTSIVVLELSSFELEDLNKSSKIAVITSIYPDHLDRYKNLADYIQAKKIIFKYQNKKDILILNYDNFQTRGFLSFSPSRVYFYSRVFIPKRRQINQFGCFVKDENVFFDNEKKPILHNIKNLKLYGDHNISNILAAVSVAKILKIPLKNIKKIVSKFKGVASRQEFIKKIKGVKYFNDTTATMPEAAITALRTFSQKFPKARIILIAGGQDKNLNYEDLAQEIQKKASYLILLPGTASDKIRTCLASLGRTESIKILFVNSMLEAVKKSSEIAKKGNIVLLSPGATSFNLFKNEFDRGEQFIKFVKKLNDKQKLS